MNIPLRISMLLFTLLCLWICSASAQTELNAIQVYDYLGREWRDPVIQQFVSNLGEDSLVVEDDLNIHCFRQPGVAIFERGEVKMILLEPKTSKGRLPFGITPRTKIADLQRDFGAEWFKENNTFELPCRITGLLNRNHTIGSIYYKLPSSYCATKPMHMAAHDPARLLKTSSETADQHAARVAAAERVLWQSLLSNQDSVDKKTQQYRETQSSPLIDKGYAVDLDELPNVGIELRLGDGIMVHIWAETELLPQLQPHLDAATLIYERSIIPGCSAPEEFTIGGIVIDGKEYEAYQYEGY